MFFVVVYAMQSHLQIIVTGCAPAVLGVTFMLITARVGLGWGHESRAGRDTIQWAVPGPPHSKESHVPTEHPFTIPDSVIQQGP